MRTEVRNKDVMRGRESDKGEEKKSGKKRGKKKEKGGENTERVTDP